MRALEIALAVLALRAAPSRTGRRRQLAPIGDDAEDALLDRASIALEHTALVASLWPEPVWQCVIPARYALLDAPASFGEIWLMSRTRHAPCPEGALPKAA